MAIFSFIGVDDGELFWDHMIQHLLLIMLAAPLFAIASPLQLAWRSTKGTAHLVVTEALRSPVAKFLGHPAVAFLLYAVLIPLSHLTSWYNLTLEHESVHNAEHLAFLVVGCILFGARSSATTRMPTGSTLPCSSSIRSSPSPSTPSAGSASSARATRSSPPIGTHRTWGPSYVTDLHIGGTIMWVLGDTLMLWPMILVALRWMHMEERKAARVDEELDPARMQS